MRQTAFENDVTNAILDWTVRQPLESVAAIGLLVLATGSDSRRQVASVVVGCQCNKEALSSFMANFPRTLWNGGFRPGAL